MSGSSRAILALVCLQAAVAGQQILFHPSVDAVVGSTTALQRELWMAGTPARALIPAEALPALFGDRDSDGLLNDAPLRFDACATSGLMIYASLASNCTLVDGSTLLDGDVFRLDPQGHLALVWSESQFAAATGAGTVDVDALAISASGEIYFSFEDDEVTNLTSVIAQNGGNALIDEQCVWRWDPSQTNAVLHLTQAAVVATMNAAFGTTATSVVDTCGLEIDPLDPTALWLTTASSSAALKGRIASTRAGGQAVQWAGVNFEPVALGFAANCALDSLATASLDWPVLQLTPDTGSSGTGTTGVATVMNLSPGTQVQLVLTTARIPGPFVMQSALPGWQGIAVDPADPLFATSFAAAELLLSADPAGTASYAFNYGGMLSGTQAMVQAIEVTTLRLSNPAVLTVSA